MSLEPAAIESISAGIEGRLELQHKWNALSDRAVSLGERAENILARWEDGEFNSSEFEALLNDLENN